LHSFLQLGGEPGYPTMQQSPLTDEPASTFADRREERGDSWFPSVASTLRWIGRSSLRFGFYRPIRR
jgi:hypothetical protein